MTGQLRVELTDDQIERMIVERSGSRAPADLVEAIMSAAEATSQRRAHLFPALPRIAQSRAAWLLVGTVLALLMTGAALVIGSYFLRPPTTLGGGGLMVVAQLDFPADGSAFAAPTSMHVFGLDEATDERVPIVELPSTSSTSYGPATWANWSPDRSHVLLFDINGHLRGITDVASHGFTTISSGEDEYDTALGDNQMTWGPTGDRFAWLGRGAMDSTSSVVTSDLSGREISRLALAFRPSAGQPSWSPDGSAILITGCVPCEVGQKGEPPTLIGHEHLFIVPVDGSPVRALLDIPASFVDGAVWSPDGAAIAYSTGAGIATVVVADGRETVVTHGHDLWPAWSPDGRHIAFGRLDDEANSVGIHVVDVDGTNLTRLTDGRDDKPDWSPDGNWLVFGRRGDMYPSVWVVAADGGEPRLIAKDATADW